MNLGLNERAWTILDEVHRERSELKVASQTLACGTEVFDFGVHSRGGLEAGVRLAEICLAGLGKVSLTHTDIGEHTWPAVSVWTDHPLEACLASQYAGWQLATDDYFGMGSGPMRAQAAHEDLFRDLDVEEDATRCVGVIESAQLPTEDLCRMIAEKCGIEPSALRLAVAKTSSIAGTIQIVARSIETALHKMHELGWNLESLHCGIGLAPLAPVAENDLSGIGVTNDAILYGGQITLWVSGEDEPVRELGPKVPSSSSSAFGKTFLEVFEEANRDFYAIDPNLFSPAEIQFHNLDTGRISSFGSRDPRVLANSFGIELDSRSCETNV